MMMAYKTAYSSKDESGHACAESRRSSDASSDISAGQRRRCFAGCGFDLKKILDVDGILLPCRSNLSQTLKNLNFRIEQSLIFVIFVLRVRVGINA